MNKLPLSGPGKEGWRRTLHSLQEAPPVQDLLSEALGPLRASPAHLASKLHKFSFV